MKITLYILQFALSISLILCDQGDIDLFQRFRPPNVDISVETAGEIFIFMGPRIQKRNGPNINIQGQLQKFTDISYLLVKDEWIDSEDVFRLYVSGSGLIQPRDGCFVKPATFISCSFQDLKPEMISEYVLSMHGEKCKNDPWFSKSISKYLAHKISFNNGDLDLKNPGLSRKGEWKSIENSESSWLFWRYLETNGTNVSSIWNEASDNSNPFQIIESVTSRNFADLYAEFVRDEIMKQEDWSSNMQTMKSGKDGKLSPETPLEWNNVQMFDTNSISTDASSLKQAKMELNPKPENWRVVQVDYDRGGKLRNGRVMKGEKEISIKSPEDGHSVLAVIPVSSDLMSPDDEPKYEINIGKNSSTNQPGYKIGTESLNGTNSTEEPQDEENTTSIQNITAISYFSIGLVFLAIDVLKDLFK